MGNFTAKDLGYGVPAEPHASYSAALLQCWIEINQVGNAPDLGGVGVREQAARLALWIELAYPGKLTYMQMVERETVNDPRSTREEVAFSDAFVGLVFWTLDQVEAGVDDIDTVIQRELLNTAESNGR